MFVLVASPCNLWRRRAQDWLYFFCLIITVLCLIVAGCSGIKGAQYRKAYDEGYRDGLEFAQQFIRTPSEAQEWLELYPDFSTYYEEHHKQRPFDKAYNEGFYNAVRKRCEYIVERSGGG